MNLKIVLLCLVLVVSMFGLSSASSACDACAFNKMINYKKGLNEEGKGVKVFRRLFFSEEQLLSAENSDIKDPWSQSADDSVNVLPALYFILNDNLVIKAVYNKFIFLVAPKKSDHLSPNPQTA
ncbi:MAG: hypothetical protein ACE5FU_10875 [Nitrospinota bacterium]